MLAEHNLNGETRFDDRRKYFLRFLATEFEDGVVPDVFINRVRRKEYVECQTLTLLKLNQRIGDCVDEAAIQSNQVVRELLGKIVSNISIMYRMCEGIALVDMLASFSHLVTTHDYVRPKLGDILAFKDARHPILDAVCFSFPRPSP